ncbi:alpha/beta hydrolase [Nocardioides oleivorans]|uniref:Alpha/beta hydrolase n=1 Tax=Nocardioides oleivorans TaxID=273676 RepID=A0A4Q2RQA6_9ACTN|nr:alpha/beta hydrolase [Nocardioides oleivorans]RYB91057.1 alpha/beta hydrolase [Nocardioides oleivorans]
MTSSTSEHFDVDVGRIHALTWGSGPRVAVALHGITANAMSWAAVARHLPADWRLVALDLRGRGRSRDLPAPFGVDDLARDARDVVAATGAEVLAGHSLGAYVALGVDRLFPGTAPRLVLVDGGLPLPVPPGVEVDAVLDAAVGPMIERLRTTYADEQAYVEFFRAHPAMGPYWSDDFEAYARYDALVTADGVRARAQEDAVRTSGRELVLRGEEIAAAVRDLAVPAHLLVAPRGMLDQAGGMLPEAAVATARAESERLTVAEVPDTNHYTVLVGDTAAQQVAAALVGSR